MPSVGRYRQGPPRHAKSALAPACRPVLPGLAPCRRRRRSNAAGPLGPCAAEFCFRGTTSLAAFLRGGHFAAPAPRKGARMRCPVTGAKRRCATGAARPVPAGCSQGIFSSRPASAFSAPGGSLCAGKLGKECVLFKAVWLLHRSDVGSTLAPPGAFVNRFLSISSYFLRFSCASCEKLCSLKFFACRFRPSAGAPTPATFHQSCRACPPCSTRPKKPSFLPDFTILLPFFITMWYAEVYRV